VRFWHPSGVQESKTHGMSLKRGVNEGFCALFAAGLALAGISGFSATFTEANSVVLIEAEGFATNLSPRSSHTWGLSNSVAGFSGSGYMEAAPNSGANITSGWFSSSPELDYSVQLTNGGAYYVWIRAYATADTDDSIHAGMDNVTNTADAITLAAAQYGAWSWTTNRMTGARPTVTGAAGPHTFQLWMREDGMRVDRVALTTDPNIQPYLGNAWHIPNNPEAAVGVPSMRIPLAGMFSNTPVTIVNGNQYQGTGNAGNQASSTSRIFYKRTTDTAWSSLPMFFLGAGGNNKYFSNSIPANTFQSGDAVQYYLRIGYTDRLFTYLYGNDLLSLTSDNEADARADPFSYSIQWPLQPEAGATYLAVTNNSSSGVLQARVYADSGHISLVGPDLAGNPLANEITFAPPSVRVGGELQNIGRVLSWTPLTNGLELIQQIYNTSVVSRLTFLADGVMRFEVINWGSLAIDSAWITAASDAGEHFYGFGEKFNQFDQAGKLVHTLTFDLPGDKGDSSYKVVPWFISTRGYGVHLDSSAESWFDMRAGAVDRFVITNLFPSLKFNVVYGPKLADVLSRYTGYSGRPSLPPTWAFAPWLSSDIWHNGGEVRYAVSKYRQLGIPGSVFVFDSPWETAYNDFNWNMTQFGNSGTYEGNPYAGFGSAGEMMTFLRTNGFKVVCWMTPFINTSSNDEGVPGQNLGPSANYAAAQAANYFVRSSPGGPPLVVPWWKGSGSPVDFSNPNARNWLAGQLSNLVWQSGGVIGGFKTDDGESGGSSGNTYIPTTAVYADGRTGIEMRNGYSLEYHKAEWNVLGTNGVLWERSGFTGTQAYPGGWAGDNEPNFGTAGLPGVVIAGQSAAMSGYSLWGSDICGYLDSNWSSTPTNLFERWTQFGALCPVMQMHRQVGLNRQYPWSFGPEGIANYQFYARLHTALFPYLYTYAQQCSTNGIPIIRPLVLMNQADPAVLGLQQTYYLGNELLVAVVISNLATSRTVYLPQGNWYDYFSNQRYAGGQNITWNNADQTQTPLFLREGAIVPMISTNVQTLCDSGYVSNPSLATMDNSLQFLVYPGTNGTSSFTLYDGTSLQSQTTGTVTRLSLSSASRPVLMRVLGAQPISVERDGVTLTKFTNATDFGHATLGWHYAAPFVWIKLNHPGGQSQISFGPDSVGDGISDSWRLTYFGSAATTNSASCAQCDPDGDGMTNLQEYLAGTDPTKANSVLRIISLDGGARMIVWNSAPGKNYRVLATANLATGFVPVSGTVPSAGTTTSFTDPGPVTTNKFYRVQLLP
jgi:alpha-D-xyloside xylohydrolase